MSPVRVAKFDVCERIGVTESQGVLRYPFEKLFDESKGCFGLLRLNYTSILIRLCAISQGRGGARSCELRRWTSISKEILGAVKILALEAASACAPF